MKNIMKDFITSIGTTVGTTHHVILVGVIFVTDVWPNTTVHVSTCFDTPISSEPPTLGKQRIEDPTGTKPISTCVHEYLDVPLHACTHAQHGFSMYPLRLF